MRQLLLIFILLSSLTLGATESKKSLPEQLKETVTLAWESMSKMSRFGEIKNCPPFTWLGDIFKKEEPAQIDPPLTPEQIKECERLMTTSQSKKKDDVDLSSPEELARIEKLLPSLQRAYRASFRTLVKQAKKSKKPEDAILNQMRQIRLKYHDDLKKESREIRRLIKEGADLKKLAIRAWKFRRDSGKEGKMIMPKKERALVFLRNLYKYKDPLGPSFASTARKAKNDLLNKKVPAAKKDVYLEIINSALMTTNRQIDKVLKIKITN